MRMKIFSAVLLGAALALAGCSGDGGSSTSTSGSSGTNASNGTSGSNGTTNSNASNGSSGNTTSQSTNGGSTGGTNAGSTGGTTSSGGACSQTNPTGTCANPGESCQRLTNPQGGHNTQCACTPAGFDLNTGARIDDSCANNTNGLIVCDGFTLVCRAPGQFSEPGTTDPACDTGLQAEAFCGAPYPDGGSYPDGGFLYADGGCNLSFEACVATCTDSSTCTVGMTCDQGICQPSLCGAEYTDDSNNLINGDYYDACDVHGTGDGTCMPGILGGIGLCTLNVDANGQGAFCNSDPYNAAADQGCASGLNCLPSQFYYLGAGPNTPGNTGVCTAVCNGLNTLPDGGNDTSITQYNPLCPMIDGQQSICGISIPLFPDGGNGYANGAIEAGWCVP